MIHVFTRVLNRAALVVLMLGSAACFTTNVLLIRALGVVDTANVWLVSGVRLIVGRARGATPSRCRA